MSANALLDKLEDVGECGSGRWRARCPVCGGKRGTLAITEAASGAVLLHCFRSGCAVADIAAASGLDLADLFPPRARDMHYATPVKRRFNAAQVLSAVNLELIEVLIVVGAILHRGSVTPTEYERLRLSLSRVSVAEGTTHE